VRKATFPWINGQIISAAETEDLAHLLATISAHLDEMNLVNLSTALHRLAKLSGNAYSQQAMIQLHNTLPVLLAAVRQALLRIEESGTGPKSQALSNITWALATMQAVDLPLLQMVAMRACGQLDDFKNFELCQLLWAFAKLGTVDSKLSECCKPLFRSAAQIVVRSTEEFSFRGLVMTAWAFATAKHHDVRLFHAIATRITPLANGANCQELANTAWSFSTAGVQEEQLFAALTHVSIPRMREFKPQELSSILWSFASIGYNHDEFYENAGRVATSVQLQGQQLANILWALTKMRPRHESTKDVLLRLLPSCTRLVATFKTQEMASVALAASKCFGGSPGSEEPQQPLPRVVTAFFQAALPLAVPNLRHYSGQSLANIATSFLAVQIGNRSGLFEGVSCEIMTRAESLENSALLLLLKTLPHAPPAPVVNSAMCQLFTEAARRMGNLPSRELQVLSRICARPLGGNESGKDAPPGNWGPSWDNREEVRVWCLTLAAKWQRGHVFSGPLAGQQATFSTTIPGAAGENREEAGDAEDEDTATSAERWAAPMKLTIANTGRASAWDAKAMEQLRESVETAAFQREEVAREEGTTVAGPAWDDKSPTKREKADNLPHFVFSVKNTFLDVEDANPFGEDDLQNPEIINMPLPPALPFIPASVSAEKLQAFRANYASFRIGNATGAKGELDTTLS